MKKIKLYAAVLMMGLFIASCDNANDAADDDDSTKKDTAVLVEDPNNTLDANPVNDTTVSAEAATEQH